jgi:hypothetical protein
MMSSLGGLSTHREQFPKQKLWNWCGGGVCLPASVSSPGDNVTK